MIWVGISVSWYNTEYFRFKISPLPPFNHKAQFGNLEAKEDDFLSNNLFSSKFWLFSGAPNECLSLNTLITLSKLFRVPLDFERCILSSTMKFVSARSSKGTWVFSKLLRLWYYFPEYLRCNLTYYESNNLEFPIPLSITFFESENFRFRFF